MNQLDSLFYMLEPRHHINVLMYHGFTDQKSFEGIENYHGKHLHGTKFCQQIKFLKENYHPVSLKEMIDALMNAKKLSPRSVAITMDDGYRSNYTVAYPVLKEFNVPAAIFLATDFIDRKDALWVDRLEFALNQTTKSKLVINLDGHNLRLDLTQKALKIDADRKIKGILKGLSLQKRNHMMGRIENLTQATLPVSNLPEMYAPMSWDEIREMKDSGLITFGAHTCSHTILTACSDFSMAEELKNSKERIEQELKTPCDYFSYPNGLVGDFDNRTKEAVKQAGFRCALTTVIGTNRLTSDIFEIKRLNIHNDGDLSGFIRTSSTIARTLRALKNGNYARAYS